MGIFYLNPSVSDFKYYINFIDGYSRYTKIYLKRSMIYTQFQKHITVFRSDNACECLSYAMQTLLTSHGTTTQ